MPQNLKKMTQLLSYYTETNYLFMNMHTVYIIFLMIRKSNYIQQKECTLNMKSAF